MSLLGLVAVFQPVGAHCVTVERLSMESGLQLISTTFRSSGSQQNTTKLEQKVTEPQRQISMISTETAVSSDHRVTSSPVDIPTGSDVTKGVFARWRSRSEGSSPSSVDINQSESPSSTGRFFRDFFRSPSCVDSRDLNIIAPTSS